LTGLYNLAYNPVKEKDLCDMDTEKWKSILVPKDVYLEIKKIAAKEAELWVDNYGSSTLSMFPRNKRE